MAGTKVTRGQFEIGNGLLKEVERRIAKGITVRQVVNLMQKASKAAENRLVEEAVIPLIEFFPIDKPVPTPAGNWHIFSPKADHYLNGLQKCLHQAHGIYVFHDSSGRAIYAGKALRQSLWSEINHAFNRKRGEVQSIKRVEPPTNRGGYDGREERQMKKVPIALHEIARYVTAYQVPTGLISKFEALIVRSFANDLLNVRMEKF
jgi:hypothetical protein